MGIAIFTALAMQAACSNGAIAEAVMSRRSEFNDAIAAADLSGIEAVLAPDVIGRNGDRRLVNREAQLDFWAGLFADGPERMTFHRSTECVEPSDLQPYAMEYGHWSGWTVGARGEGGMSGRYVAQWMEQDGVWLLYGELFLSTGCEGTFCPDAAPSEGR
jgi:hypothetical protein